MSMNGFLRAFPPSQMNIMKNDKTSIERLIHEEQMFLFEADVGDAWHVLIGVLDGDGFYAGEQITDVMTTGAILLTTDEVKEEAAKLAARTHAGIIKNLRELSADSELYHLQGFKENEAALLAQFDVLAAFFKKAAAHGLTAVINIA